MPFVVKCCPVIKQWDCCCHCELRTAALCVGWMYMVLSIIVVSFIAVELTESPDVEDSSFTSLDTKYKKWIIAKLVESIVSVLLYGVLLFGVHNKKAVYMLPYLVFELIGIIIYVIIIVRSCFMLVYVGSYALSSISILANVIALKVFVWIVFYSFHRQLVDERASVSVNRVVNCTHQNLNEEETVQNSVGPTEFHSTTNNDLQKMVV